MQFDIITPGVPFHICRTLEKPRVLCSTSDRKHIYSIDSRRATSAEAGEVFNIGWETWDNLKDQQLRCRTVLAEAGWFNLGDCFKRLLLV